MNSNKKPGLPGIKLAISPDDLIGRLNDNPNDFKVIYNVCSGPIINILKYILGVETAKDVQQEAMVILWKNRHTIKTAEGLKSFLYTVCRNKCIDILRRDARMHNRKFENHRKVKNLEKNMHKYILESNVLTLLSMQCLLNNEEIKVLSYCLDKYKLKEISVMMHKSVSTVSKIKATAKQKLQNYYRNDNDA